MEFPLNETSLMIFLVSPLVQSIELFHRVWLKPNAINKVYLVREISPTFVVNVYLDLLGDKQDVQINKSQNNRKYNY